MRSFRCFLAGALLAVGLLSLAACGHSNNAATSNTGQEATPNAQAQPAANAAPSSNQPVTASYQSYGQSQNTQAQNPNQQNVPPQQPTPLTPPQNAAAKLAIPQGTAIAVRLDQSLSSARNRGGDSFLASLNQPIRLADGETIPQGTRVTGRVVSARSSGHLKTPAELSIALTSLDFKGRAYSISTSQYTLVGQSHKKHDLKWIGGSAAGGALLGGLIGRGKGVAIGSLIGAGGGTAAAYATGKKDITLPAETPVRFVLRQPVMISRT